MLQQLCTHALMQVSMSWLSLQRVHPSQLVSACDTPHTPAPGMLQGCKAAQAPVYVNVKGCTPQQHVSETCGVHAAVHACIYG
ncbi:hypothetical protein COO60DRAFT_267605 [Scenedesmus sp. NREL 46B-D3]|nr:hypothetical protein COO60DRAFT_267605 [Scenedesmus sp. NREL 46B-D3]